MPSFYLLVTIFGWLLPPACREHVLGDLQERAKSRWQFVKEATSVLAPVIVSRIRRVTDAQVVLMQALAVYISFVAAAWYSGENSFLYQQAGLIRLAVPTAVSIAVLLLCAAYAHPERQSVWRPALHAAISIAAGLLGQALVFDTWPNFAVPLLVLLEGGSIAVVLVSTLQMLFPSMGHYSKFTHQNTAPKPSRMEPLPVKILLQKSFIGTRSAELPAWRTWAIIATLIAAALFVLRFWFR
jgi:hypothetical protein